MGRRLKAAIASGSRACTPTPARTGASGRGARQEARAAAAVAETRYESGHSLRTRRVCVCCVCVQWVMQSPAVTKR